MTDRELLEAAAKAAGIIIGEWSDECQAFWCGNAGTIIWNPLNDDGDALRLAVTCSINFHEQWRWNGHSGYAAYRVLAGLLLDATNTGSPAPTRRQHTWCGEEYEAHGGDKLQATRRAIVRAAAEIGRSS